VSDSLGLGGRKIIEPLVELLHTSAATAVVHIK
jgi:hypothetical protein